MAYIGKTPVIGNFQKCDSIAVVNGQAAYTLQVGGTNVSPQSENHMLVSLNGILQAPVDSFTVSGSTLTFASNLITGDVIDFVMILGNVLDLGVPSDGTVTSAKLGSDVTQGITEADMWRLTADITADVNPIASNLERVDDASFAKIGTGMSVASGTWTFPRTGLYYVSVKSRILASLDNVSVYINGTINNSTYDLLVTTIASGASGSFLNDAIGFTYVNVTDTSNVKVRFQASSISVGSSVGGSSSDNQTTFTFIRLGDSQ